MKIEVESLVPADRATTWEAWNTPADIERWNAASDDWHTPRSEVDLRVGGEFCHRMEARDGSVGFDFRGTYTRVDAPARLEYRLEDGRQCTVEFEEVEGGTLVRESFDAESENPAELQRQGWQAILDNFARHVGSRAG